MNQQKLREWILKQKYFSLNPEFDGMTAWELAGIIIRESRSEELDLSIYKSRTSLLENF